MKQKIIKLRSMVAEMLVRSLRIKALLTQPTEEKTALSAKYFVATIWFLEEKKIPLYLYQNELVM